NASWRVEPVRPGGRGLWTERLRAIDAVALGVVDAELPEALQDLVVLHELRYGADAHDLTDAVDGIHHGPVDRIGDDVLHQTAVDLEIVHRQVLQVGERGDPGTEVVQRKPAAAFA